MRTLATLALVLSLASTASAKPRHHAAPRAKQTAWLKACIHERTGPDGGIPVAEARTLCLAEQPEDDVDVAKRQLTEARAKAKVTKARERAAKAIEACEQAIVDSCVATARDDGTATCEDTDLKTAFAVCH